MLLAEEVIDGLHRIERAEGYFHKDGVPVAHGAVPQTGEFESLQVFAILRFVGDKAGIGVYILGQVKLVALVVAYGTNQVYGIEMGSFFKHGFLRRILHVNL